MKKKTVLYKITKKAKDRYLLEERHKFMFFWTFFIKGSIRLRLPKYYASFEIAEKAVTAKAKDKNIQPIFVHIK